MKSKPTFVQILFLIIPISLSINTVENLGIFAFNEFDTFPKPDTLTFSEKRGFYNSARNVEVGSEIPNAIIKYTLDGSDPAASSTLQQSSSPVVIFIDPENTFGGRGKNPGVVVRACAVFPDQTTSSSKTHTYIFADKVETLSPDNTKPGPGWPEPSFSYSQQYYNYGLDADVINDVRYKDLIDDAILSIPTISISTDLKNLFDPTIGIYENALQDGPDWERPASVELINPDGSDGFQINCGIRIRGGWSRHDDNPKHAFRLFFRTEYGEGKLKYKLFGDEGGDEFDKLDLRTSQNYSWSYKYDSGKYNTMNRDVFSRDLQREMGQPYTRSRYYHLFLNGVYWGLYQSQERSESSFGTSYLGGNVEDYDVIKPGTDENYSRDVVASDGNMDAYTKIWDMCKTGFTKNANYFKLLGKDENGNRDNSLNILVDIDNLIDYMLVIFYTGNFDSPTSKFGGNNMPNNFFCIYNRNNKDDGFKFFAHDAEHTLRTDAGEGDGIGINEDRVNIQLFVSRISGFNPQWLHYKLASNAEYKIKFTDHVYKHFFNNGCLTPEKTTALFQSRANEIDMAIIAESARWGDAYYQPKRTKDDDWLWAVNDIINNYFPYRGDIVLSQLQKAKLYPNIEPPVFLNGNDEITSQILEAGKDYKIILRNPNNSSGTIKYTIDGTDPRKIGGEVSTSSINGGNETELEINSTTIIKTRILFGTTWSALHEITIFTNNITSEIKVTEIHYHPLDGIAVTDNEFEFLELKNIGNTPVNLSQAKFVNGIDYTFPSGTIINPNNFIVLVSNKIEFNNRYGFLPFGEYLGQLDNGGEKISLVSATSDTIFSIRYNDKNPWPETPDTLGYSLVPTELNPSVNQNDPLNWRASYFVHGSPNKDDLPTGINSPENSLPKSFILFQNYPNPFNPETEIKYAITKHGFVSLIIYDALGREVAVLVNEYQSAGFYKVTFSGKQKSSSAQLSSGIYFFTLRTEEGTVSKKMVFLK